MAVSLPGPAGPDIPRSGRSKSAADRSTGTNRPDDVRPPAAGADGGMETPDLQGAYPRLSDAQVAALTALGQRRAAEQVRYCIAAEDMPEFVQEHHAAALAAPGARFFGK